MLKAEHIKAGMAVKDISFEVREGEVLGLSGLVGAGRTEAVRAILGVDKMESGTVTLRGKPIHLKSTKEAYAHGIGFLPEDRKNQGVLLHRPIYQNITLSCQKKIAPFGWIFKSKEMPIVDKYVKEVTIKTMQ